VLNRLTQALAALGQISGRSQYKDFINAPLELLQQKRYLTVAAAAKT
jgi:hypothetical protein